MNERITLSSINIDIDVLPDGKLDAWIATEGSSGAHYVGITPKNVADNVQDLIECMMEAYIGERIGTQNLEDKTDYLTNPLPLKTQWTICDDKGYLEGTILMSLNDLISKDHDTLLDLMSSKLVGDVLLEDISYSTIGTTEDSNVKVKVRGNIYECEPTDAALNEVCEMIKTAIINAGDDAIRDFLGAVCDADAVYEEMDDAMSQMPIEDLIRFFKKYVAKA